MIRATVVMAFLTGTALTVALGGRLALGQQGELDLTIDPFARKIMWADQQNETVYRVSGELLYVASLDCPFDPTGPNETVSFNEELPPNTANFPWPAVQNEELTVLKDINITVEAIGASGEVLATDNIFKQPEPFCPGAPVTGTGPTDGAGSFAPVAAASLLLMTGILLIASAGPLRRRL